MRAIKREDIENITFYQTPKWLFDLLLEGKITPGAYTTYILMYDRVRLSSKNGWIDKNGDVYIKYSYEEMLVDLKVKSNTQIQRNLSKLLELGLLDKKKNYSSSTTYYLNIYSPTQNVVVSPTQNVVVSPTQNVVVSPTQNVETSNNNMNKNNIKRTCKEELVSFEKLFKEELKINFTATNQKAVEKLLKQLKTEEAVKSFLYDNYKMTVSNKEKDPTVKTVEGLFVHWLKKGERIPEYIPKLKKEIKENLEKNEKESIQQNNEIVAIEKKTVLGQDDLPEDFKDYKELELKTYRAIYKDSELLKEFYKNKDLKDLENFINKHNITFGGDIA